MKNPILILLFALIPFTSHTQDSITELPDSYITFDGWCDDYPNVAFGVCSQVLHSIVGYVMPKDTTVYGIAISYYWYISTSSCTDYWHLDQTDPSVSIADSLIDSTYEFVCRYGYDSQTRTVSILDSHKVCIRDPVTHWLDPNKVWFPGTGATHIPIFETYFDQPYTYHTGDTLFIGTTHWKTWQIDPILQALYPQHPYPLRLISVNSSSCRIDHIRLSPSSHGTQWTVVIGNSFTPLIFPILSPNPNEPVDIDRPTAAAPAALAVSPNPADGSATLRCGVPLAEVLLSDATGRTLLRVPCHADGSAPTLDTRALPSGLYIVRALPRDGSAPIAARLCVAH